VALIQNAKFNFKFIM